MRPGEAGIEAGGGGEAGIEAGGGWDCSRLGGRLHGIARGLGEAGIEAGGKGWREAGNSQGANVAGLCNFWTCHP